MIADTPQQSTDSGWPQRAARLLLLLQSLSVLCSEAAAAAMNNNRDRKVYWNASNPIFQPAGENVLQVRLQDRINFVCPNNGLEYYQIYWTPLKEQAESCSGGTMLFSCRHMDSYLVYVQIFPADPTAPGFLNPVYFYTPSTGDLLGLDQKSGGACQSRNMRITVRTDGDDSDSSSQKPPDSTTQLSTVISTSGTSSGSTATSLNDSARKTTQATTLVQRWTTDEAVPTTTRSSTSGGEAPPTTERDLRHADSSRMNLITGSSVAMPTGPIIAALTCCSLAASQLLLA